MKIKPEYFVVIVACMLAMFAGRGFAAELPIVVTVTGDAEPDGTIKVTVATTDGSTIANILQIGGATASIMAGEDDGDPTTVTLDLTLGAKSLYKDELIRALREPPLGTDQLPDNVPVPPEPFPAGLPNRFQVVGVNPYALAEAGRVTLEVSSNDGDTAEVDINTALPWKVTSGIHNVPIGVPVLLHGKDQISYDWEMTLPSGDIVNSDVNESFGGQNPVFTPNATGLHEVTVTDKTGDVNATFTLQIYAGTWKGVIVGQDFRLEPPGPPVSVPMADTLCTDCHNGGEPPYFAADQFTPWAQSGHAEIFTDNLNAPPVPYKPDSCFACHTVGYDPEVDNGGIDDALDFTAFLQSKLLTKPQKNNWKRMLKRYEDSARLANIQCENCHGPQKGGAHYYALFPPTEEGPPENWVPPRTSLSSDTCAVCHGKPPGRARFQQWQLSGHANYERASGLAERGSCSRCHTGNGFLTWLPVLLDENPMTDPTDDIAVSWTSDGAHPQTCATCHDPHSIGTKSGKGPDPSVTDATVRISDDTPPLIAGFEATGVGKGAICMTCHNSRRGLRNDDTFSTPKVQGDLARAPHGSAQADVLMGQNAFLVPYGDRGAHSNWTIESPIPEPEDTCVTCHMEATPPPGILAYKGGTNHTFFARNDICGECHDGFATGDTLQNSVQTDLDLLQDKIETALWGLLIELTALGYSIDWDGEAYDLGEIENKIVFGEFRGRQSMTLDFAPPGPGDEDEGPFQMNSIYVDNGQESGELYKFADPALIKAGWNYNLIVNDGSLGVHNPSFVQEILSASRASVCSLVPQDPECI